MIEWANMADMIPEGQAQGCVIEHFEVSERDSEMTRIRAMMHPNEYVPAGRYCRLGVNKALVMSDTQYEKHTNMQFVYAAKGDVLIGGLGIGMVLVPVLRKPGVKSVLVVEKQPGVVELVEPAIRANVKEADKLTVVTDDILTWKPPRGKRWDTIYFDIWTDCCEDNLDEITKLKRRFCKRLNGGGYMGAWEEYRLRRLRRQDRDRYW